MRENLINKKGPRPDQRNPHYKGLDRCWDWTGPTDPKGYGLECSKIQKRTDRAHRVAWEEANGPIPKGDHILHKCDRPCCVNPSHLFKGDHLTNMQDCSVKGRNVTHKISKKVIEKMFKMTHEGLTRKEISDKLEIPYAVVLALLSGDKRKLETAGLLAGPVKDRKLSEKEKSAILKLHAEGKLNKEISEILNIPYSRIYMFLGKRSNRKPKKVKVPKGPRLSTPGAPRITAEDVVEIRRLRELGHSRITIGKMFDLWPAAVGLICSRKVWQHVS